MTVRRGSADMTKVETGLREVDLLTRQKWRQDCKVLKQVLRSVLDDLSYYFLESKMLYQG